MSLFKKKKTEVKVKVKQPACSCNAGCPTSEVETMDNTNKCCPQADTKICSIKVLGSGCKNCHTLYENTKTALSKMRIGVEVEYITDMQKVMEYGVMSMPALVVNEKVVAMGKVYKSQEVEVLLQKLGFKE